MNRPQGIDAGAVAARHSIDLAYAAVNESSATPVEQKEIRAHLRAVDAYLSPMTSNLHQ